MWLFNLKIIKIKSSFPRHTRWLVATILDITYTELSHHHRKILLDSTALEQGLAN